MNIFECNEVDAGWEDVANPDDVEVTILLDQTEHKFYPSTREIVLLYDVIDNKRDAEFVIGTADYVIVSSEDVSSDIVDIDLAPIHFRTERATLINSLKLLLCEVFKNKDDISGHKERDRGLELIQCWVDNQNGDTDVRALYSELVNDNI